MKPLRPRINHFFRYYDLSTFGHSDFTRADMCDRDALMTAYEAIWLTLEEFDGTKREHKWLTDLYGDLGDYIADECYRDYAKAIDKDCKLALLFGIVGTICFASCLPNSVDFATIGGLLTSLVLVFVGTYERN